MVEGRCSVALHPVHIQGKWEQLIMLLPELRCLNDMGLLYASVSAQEHEFSPVEQGGLLGQEHDAEQPRCAHDRSAPGSAPPTVYMWKLACPVLGLKNQHEQRGWSCKQAGLEM